MKFVFQHNLVNWEPPLSRAQPRFGLDPGDGVKVNYLEFCETLAPIVGMAAKKE